MNVKTSSIHSQPTSQKVPLQTDSKCTLQAALILSIFLSTLALIAGAITYQYGFSDPINLSLWISGGTLFVLSLTILALSYCKNKSKIDLDKKAQTSKTAPTVSLDPKVADLVPVWASDSAPPSDGTKKPKKGPTKSVSFLPPDWKAALKEARQEQSKIQNWAPIYTYIQSKPLVHIEGLDSSGNTIFHLAAQESSAPAIVLIILIDPRAINEQNRNGETGFDLVKQIKNANILEFFSYLEKNQINLTLAESLMTQLELTQPCVIKALEAIRKREPISEGIYKWYSTVPDSIPLER